LLVLLATVVLKAKKENAPTAKDEAGALSWEDKKKRANRKKQLPARRDEVVSAIEAAEARKAAIHALWAEPDFYMKTPHAEIASLDQEEKAIGPRIDALVAEWEALEAEIAEVG